jgi:hypothetical protein
VLHGRPATKSRIYRWIRNLAERIKGMLLSLVPLKNLKDFLATLSTSPGIALWLKV